MITSNIQDEDKFEGGGTLKARHIAVIVVVAVAAAAFFYYWFMTDREAEPPAVGTGQVAVVPEGSRTVVLYFADTENTVLVGA